MVHPTTGETISSYKKLMNDPVTAEIWKTAANPIKNAQEVDFIMSTISRRIEIAQPYRSSQWWVLGQWLQGGVMEAPVEVGLENTHTSI
jgi:hypothetical protein